MTFPDSAYEETQQSLPGRPTLCGQREEEEEEEEGLNSSLYGNTKKW